MKLTAKEDINLSVEDAFDAVADLDFMERRLLRAGVRVERDGTRPEATFWRVVFTYGGAPRDAELKVAEWSPPRRAVVTGVSKGLTVDALVEFIPLARTSTRVKITAEVKASGFRDKMMLQGLQVAKARLSSRFGKAVSGFVRDAESRAVGA